MALRSLIPVEDIRVAHVNSEDNSTTYESGVAYKAGTMVTYEGAAYVAASDIAEDDTDLPNTAPLKWGLVPNAFTSGGDDSGLASRVSALEDIVDNPDSTPTEDSTALITSGGVFDAIATDVHVVGISESTSIFDLLTDGSDHHIYGSYASNITNGSDTFATLLGVSVYARVIVHYYQAYLGYITVVDPGGIIAQAYCQPNSEYLNFLKSTETGNTVIRIDPATP